MEDVQSRKQADEVAKGLTSLMHKIKVRYMYTLQETGGYQNNVWTFKMYTNELIPKMVEMVEAHCAEVRSAVGRSAAVR